VASRRDRKVKELRDRHRAFRSRRLGEVRLVVLFLEAVYLPTRPGIPKDVLVAWGFAENGGRVVLNVRLGQSERDEDWLAMGRDLVRRRLRAPCLVVADGTPGLIRAAEHLWPNSDRQGCTVHRLREVLADLPDRQDLRESVRAAYWAALDNTRSEAEAQSRLRALAGDLEIEHPGAAASLARDLPALSVHLRYPAPLHRRLRSTDLLASSLGQAYGRTGLIDWFAREKSRLRLSWAVLDLVIASTPWARSALEVRQLIQMRDSSAAAGSSSGESLRGEYRCSV
jgi:transposase-like protein